MACFAAVCGGCLCCCGGCTGCVCWTGYRVGKIALRAVKHLRARPPCEKGLACQEREGQHCFYYSHPDDDDYGFSVRVHGGQGEFCTLRQCFNFMDPYIRGYVNEVAALRELLNHVGRHDAKLQRSVTNNFQKLRALWKEIDTDGNGYISFPEFVEWALGSGAKFGFPQHVGIVGPQGRARPYGLKCTRCPCVAFQSADSGDRFCSSPDCGHRYGFHAVPPEVLARAALPRNWTSIPSSLPADLAGQRQLVDCGQEVVSQIQQLMDASVRTVWTRDRGRNLKVPTGYQVVRVDRNENARLWLKYVLKKTLIAEAITSSASTNNLPPLKSYGMLTTELAKTLPLFEGLRPEEQLNEWYLWHGGSSRGIKSIADEEFKILYAGSTTGTLYGAGTYLTDSCTKADEYAKKDVGDEVDVFSLLLCRVMGGRVNYTDEVTPDPKTLTNSVLQGPYDCVFGDREKCRGTFKEVVIYESSQAFPEYIVYYQRRFDGAGA